MSSFNKAVVIVSIADALRFKFASEEALRLVVKALDGFDAETIQEAAPGYIAEHEFFSTKTLIEFMDECGLRKVKESPPLDEDDPFRRQDEEWNDYLERLEMDLTLEEYREYRRKVVAGEDVDE